MKHALLPLALAALVPAVAQIPNPGFEEWAPVAGVDQPVGWTTFNALGSLYGLEFAEAGSPGAVGNAFLRLTAQEIPNAGPMLSLAISGTGVPGRDGFPWSTLPTSLEGRFRFTPQGVDEGHVVVAFYKWDPVAHARIGLGGGFLSISTLTPEWSTFSVPMAYYNPLQPDTATISLISGGGQPTQPGSVFDVDELAFQGTYTSVAEHAVRPHLLAYPSPTRDLLHWSLPTATGSLQWQVWAMDGRVLLQGREASARGVIDVQGLPTGSYLLRTTDAQGTPVTARFHKH